MSANVATLKASKVAATLAVIGALAGCGSSAPRHSTPVPAPRTVATHHVAPAPGFFNMTTLARSVQRQLDTGSGEQATVQYCSIVSHDQAMCNVTAGGVGENMTFNIAPSGRSYSVVGN